MILYISNFYIKLMFKFLFVNSLIIMHMLILFLIAIKNNTLTSNTVLSQNYYKIIQLIKYKFVFIKIVFIYKKKWNE